MMRVWVCCVVRECSWLAANGAHDGCGEGLAAVEDAGGGETENEREGREDVVGMQQSPWLVLSRPVLLLWVPCD